MNYIMNPDVIIDQVDGEAMLLDMKTGWKVFGFDKRFL
jgi:hypothetical protein